MPFQVMPMGGGRQSKSLVISIKFSRLIYNSLLLWNEILSMFHHKKLFTWVGFSFFFPKIAVKIGSKIHKSGLVLPFLISKTVKNIYYIQITKIFKTVLLILLFFLLKTFFTNVRWKITTFEFLRKHDKAFCFYINLNFQNRFSSKYLTHKIVVTFF